MDVYEFIAHLDGVRQTGKGRWVARCPSHADKSPSLAISQGDRVPILLHCFAGCDTDMITAALGMQLSDLMPERVPDDQAPRPLQRMPFSAADAMRCLSKEANFLLVCASDLAAGQALDRPTIDALVVAAGRINEARRICNV